MNALARLVSYLFHPLLLATYLFSLLAWALPIALDPIPMANHRYFLVLIFMITALLPLLNIGIFKAFGTIKTLHMQERQERVVPFTFTAVIYIIITYLLYSQTRLSMQDNFLRFMIIIDALVLIAAVITWFYKISVHSLAIWGIIGILLPLNKLTEVETLFIPTLVTIVIAGFVMSSRLYLNAHSSREVMWGSIVGFATSLSSMLIIFGR